MIKVGLDPGHGGSLTGATRPWFQLSEADYNLSFSRQLKIAIANSGLPFEPHLLRNANNSMSLRERARQSIEFDCDLVIHIHVNAANNPEFHGGMVFNWPMNQRTGSMGDVIARSIPAPLFRRGWSCLEATDLPTADDDWLERPRDVMRYHPMNTVLLELGYMSNKSDAVYLMEDPIKAGWVQAVLAGLADYWRTEK